jgi:Fe-S-cluster containining protein
MPLTGSDIKRIMKLGYRFRVFVVKKGKERYLKNSEGKCIFLEDKGCKIYNSRPAGCRLYPLIFDESSGKTVLDDFCPYGCEFQYNKEEITKLKNLIKSL